MRMIGPGSSECAALGFLRTQTPSSGREQRRDDPGRDQRDGDDSEDREGVFARGAVGETDRDEPAIVTSVPVSLGKAVEL